MDDARSYSRGAVRVGSVAVGRGNPLVIIAGPCVIEDPGETLETALALAEKTRRLDVPFIFKSSYDKANRTSGDSYRGPGLSRGLEVLARIREEAGVPVTSDVHSVEEVGPAAKVLDLLQIPAFLCRQTDLVKAAAGCGRPVNIKKGQFMNPADMRFIMEKAASAGDGGVMLTERGTFFGYGNLVVDMRSLVIMRALGCPVVFDATHSVQLPGGLGGSSGGESQFIPLLARAAVSVGVDAVFIEVHKAPERALCDGANSLPLERFESLVQQLIFLNRTVESWK
ncbi:MAG: 3-deoxy-8-phosphooctulonate synthase [Deltaproteobacteria bacterium]|nr:3-deoxy-8-phosphooctulonate synthase [Deltaproteobacteria bacterium]